MQLVGPLVRFYDFESGAKGKPGYRPERNLDVEAIIAKWEGLQPEPDRRRAGADRRHLRQRAGRARHRPEDRRGPDQGIRQPGGAAGAGGRDQAAQAPRDPARQHRSGPALAKARGAGWRTCRSRWPLDDLRLPKPDPQKLVGFLKAMEFNTLTRRIAQMLHVDPEAVKPDPALLPGARPHGYGNGAGGSDAVPFFGDSVPPDPETAAAGPERPPGAARPSGEVDPFADLDLPDAPPKPRGPVEPTPANVVAARAAESVKPFDTAAYETDRVAGAARRLDRRGRGGRGDRGRHRDRRAGRQQRQPRRRLARRGDRAGPPTSRWPTSGRQGQADATDLFGEAPRPPTWPSRCRADPARRGASPG